MAKSIAVDLERRGFIVYITVSSAEEERIVQLENRVDVRALWVDLTTVCWYCANRERMQQLTEIADTIIAI